MSIVVSALRTTNTESKSGASTGAEGMGWVFDLGCGEAEVATLADDWVGYRRWWWSNGCERYSRRRRWEGEGDSYVCFVRGMLVESGDGKVTYEGGSRKCMVVREGTGAEELFKMVRKMIGTDKSEEKLWYNLKYDREMLVPVEVDSNVEVIFKGNEEHGYLYVARNARPVRQEHARAAVCEARERDTGEGKQIGRSGRKCNDEVAEECGNNEAGVKRSVGVEGGEQPGNRLRVGGDAIELSDDDEISIVSEDADDAEAAEEDDVGDEGAAENKCGEGSKREGCDDGNDLGKKMDHHKMEMLKWKNGVGERIEQKLADTYKKMGCIAAVECYSLMLSEYSIELTNSRRLVVKRGQQTCTYRQ
ncbi:LOW QUALITY PROTEIN: hypothetical protein Cgig2_024552 [Carnegiea gigantea]|uniref:Uncharacterized protein n=1 Tax=Carnegiea gigantea TaxID=171969 RepID=A0A9Q1JNP2_9CARY|nr:LOW QUALITY PROTEIN: hypothetical protein Cgig2_024552 [Carnegiea gigantea]